MISLIRKKDNSIGKETKSIPNHQVTMGNTYAHKG